MVRDRVHFLQVREPSRLDPAPSPGPPTLLSSFELEQDGDRIRIYDADGSVYDGQVAASIEPASQFAGITSASEQAKRGLSLADKSQIGQKAGQLGATASQQKTVFRASGTNRALNQLVVINGTLISATNAGAKANTDSPAQSGPDPTLSYNAPAPPAAIPPLLRIQGRAKFGATNEMEINAVRGPSR